MITARPRTPVDLPLSARECEADGATHFSAGLSGSDEAAFAASRRRLEREGHHRCDTGSGKSFIDPIRRDPTDATGKGWILCDEADAEAFGLYELIAEGLALWISDHPTRVAAEAAQRKLEGAA